MPSKDARGGCRGGRRGRGAGRASASSEQPAPKRVKTQPSGSPHKPTANASIGPPQTNAINACCIAEVLDAVNTIIGTMPGVKSQYPISEASGGYIAPYNPTSYITKWGEAGPTGQMHYQYGINIVWQNSIASPFRVCPYTSRGSMNLLARSRRAS